MNALAPITTDLAGRPYAPAVPRPWLDAACRADFARQFDCAPTEVEYRLDARAEADRKARERVEYEDPYGYDGRRY